MHVVLSPLNKIKRRNILGIHVLSVSNSLDREQAGRFVGPVLCPNCLQSLSDQRNVSNLIMLNIISFFAFEFYGQLVYMFKIKAITERSVDPGQFSISKASCYGSSLPHIIFKWIYNTFVFSETKVKNVSTCDRYAGYFDNTCTLLYRTRSIPEVCFTRVEDNCVDPEHLASHTCAEFPN